MRTKLLLALASTMIAIILCELVLMLFAGKIYTPPFYPGDVEAVPDETFDPQLWKPAFQLSNGKLVPMTEDSRPGALRSFLHQKSRLHRLGRKLEHSLSRRFAVGYRWRLNRALFTAIRDECRRVDLPLLVVHIPVNRRKPAPAFEREFADMEIEYLDLTPRLPANADALYYPRDRHFNAAGHRFAAEEIHRALVERDLLK